MPKNLKDANFYDDLGDALHDLVKFAPSGNSARRIAALTGMPYSTLMNGLSRTESNAGCQHVITALEPIVSAAGGERFMAEYFSLRAGGVFVVLPELAGQADQARQVVMETMGELGALCRSFEHALDEHGPGGREVTLDEFKLFEAQSNKLMSKAKGAIVACREVLKQHKVEG